jgi:hypothetical protein
MKPLDNRLAAAIRRRFGAGADRPEYVANMTYPEIRSAGVGHRGIAALAVWCLAHLRRPWWLPVAARHLDFPPGWRCPLAVAEATAERNRLERISDYLRPDDNAALAAMLGSLTRGGIRWTLGAHEYANGEVVLAVYRLASECRPVDPESDPAGDPLSDVGTE